jgi:Ca2+-binding EF-hand superfamily protein
MRALAGMIIALMTAAASGQEKGAPPGPQPIARAQFLASMDGEFRKMDADKNGQLTRTEIEQFQKLQAVAEAEARNKEWFVRLDTNKNGSLSAAEFAKMVTPPPAANAQPMLARMDGNRDSQVSLVEYRTATLANFDRLDRDKDGTVTPAEMKAGGIAPR